MDLDTKKVKKILIRSVNWVGDTVLTFPAVQAIRDLFPHSQISVLTNDIVADLWMRFPFVDEILTYKKRKGIEFFLEDFRIYNILRKKNFDLAFIFPRSFHSAFQVYLSQIPIRIGYKDSGRSLLLSYGVLKQQDVFKIHRIFFYKRLVEIFGNDIADYSPKIFLRQEDRAYAERFMSGFGISNHTPVIGLNPGATYGLAKCWSPTKFGELGKRISKKWGAKVIIFGNINEKPIAQKILSIIGEDGIDLSGKTTLIELAALLERCKLLITNDTGTMHLSAALETPVIAIFGSTDPKRTGPWGNGHIVIKKDVPCSPCFKRICPGDHRCMELITVDEVEEIVNKKLSEVFNRQ